MIVRVPLERGEEARATMLELVPAGFEEVERPDELHLFAYADSAAVEPIRAAFGSVAQVPVESGWEERWKEFHRGIRIGEIWIGPPWETPPPGTTAVRIDPGRAFGTGAHETTRLCVEFLIDLSADRGSLLDVGCGSGVLSIVAAKLGFVPVLAVDVDPVAVETTLANAAANDVRVEARVTDAVRDELPPADVACANLSAAAVTAVGPSLPVEQLVTSGYHATDEPALASFRHVRRRVDDPWAADLYERE